ncbi:FkbM family methyltransferase [Mesorhizobium sp. CAU 1732]|uniref:FkbM family methyltransferase n=1 Tax=Mesorhizobium sp. CAU 1732 TaxID=3140358 RepID=UPI00326054B0
MTTRRPMRSLEEFCGYLIGRGLAPGTVIDVGAANGTPEITKALPDAYYVLIDPVPSYEGQMKYFLSKHRGEYHLVALSDVAGTMQLTVSKGSEHGATLSAAPGKETIAAPVETMDGMFLNREFAGPIMVKTDCQGYDMHAMRGGREFLKRVDVAVCETLLFHPTMEQHLPDFGDTVAVMRELGFAVFDIVSYQTRPFDNALGYVDLVFVREDGPFRRHHRWA